MRTFMPEISMGNFERIEQYRRVWAAENFREQTSLSAVDKAEEEIGELREWLNKFEDGNYIDEYEEYEELEEFVDVVMCLFDSMRVRGYSIEEFVNCYAFKVEKNRRRRWSMDNGVYKHIKQE